MSDKASNKPLWPQTPEGTTDWEVVFEDPRVGLIAAVSSAKSADALKLSTTLIIKKLFTRDDDEAEVKRFTTQLHTITANVETAEQLAATMQAVMGLLRQIKDGRQLKAREYLEARKRGQQSPERRTKQKKKKSGKSALLTGLLAAGNPKIALPIIGVIIAIIAGTAYFFAQPDPKTEVVKSGTGTTTESPAGVAKEAISKKPAPEPTPSPKKPKPESEPEEDEELVAGVKKAKWPRAVLLQPMEWPLLRKDLRKRPVSYAMLLYVDKAKAISAICLTYPYVKESFLMAFGAVRPDSEQPKDGDLVKIGKLAQKRINKRVGPAVLFVEIYPYGDPKFRTTNTPPCRLER